MPEEEAEGGERSHAERWCGRSAPSLTERAPTSRAWDDTAAAEPPPRPAPAYRRGSPGTKEPTTEEQDSHRWLGGLWRQRAWRGSGFSRKTCLTRCLVSYILETFVLCTRRDRQMDLLAPWGWWTIAASYSRKPGTSTIRPRSSETASSSYVP